MFLHLYRCRCLQESLLLYCSPYIHQNRGNLYFWWQSQRNYPRHYWRCGACPHSLPFGLLHKEHSVPLCFFPNAFADSEARVAMWSCACGSYMQALEEFSCTVKEKEYCLKGGNLTKLIFSLVQYNHCCLSTTLVSYQSKSCQVNIPIHDFLNKKSFPFIPMNSFLSRSQICMHIHETHCTSSWAAIFGEGEFYSAIPYCTAITAGLVKYVKGYFKLESRPLNVYTIL